MVEGCVSESETKKTYERNDSIVIITTYKKSSLKEGLLQVAFPKSVIKLMSCHQLYTHNERRSLYFPMYFIILIWNQNLPKRALSSLNCSRTVY